MLSILFETSGETSRYALFSPRLTPHAAASPSQLCSLKQISLVHTPRAKISRVALAGGSMLYKMTSQRCAKRTYELYLRQSWCSAAQGTGFIASFWTRTLRAALYRMPSAARDGRIHLNSTESPSVAGIRSHRQLREANKGPHHIRSTPSSSFIPTQKGLPHTSHASSHHRSIDRGPWGSKAIAQSSLAVAGMERHGSEDGRRMAPQ
jgi:hypothetical protein